MVILVVEEQLFAHFDWSVGEDADAMISIHADYTSLAVWIQTVVCKADLVSLKLHIFIHTDKTVIVKNFIRFFRLFFYIG